MTNHSLLDVISFVFNKVHPKLFVAFGDHAKYVQCVPQPILGLGVDPWPSMNLKNLPVNQQVYPVTCDYFFHSAYMIKELHPDVVLISGFYRFEQVLRDMMFAEKLCSKNSVIMINNTVPLSEEDLDRSDITPIKHQTGDIFKLISVLRKYRPDIKISTLTDVDKGVTILTNLDEANHVLQNELVGAVNDVINLSFEQRDSSTDMTFEEYKKNS